MDGTVHFAVLVFEDAQVGDFAGEPVDLFRSVRVFHSDEQHIADAYMLWFECGVDFSACLVDHAQFGTAHIKAVKPDRVRRALDKGSVAIVAGFQGVNEGGDATTLGRGGSDTSAVALAVALDADVCEIYTDVDGVFTADPRIVPTARRIPVIDYESMLEMSSCGSKVLALRCVEYAQRFDMPLHVRSSFSHRRGTLIVPEDVDPRTLPNI